MKRVLVTGILAALVTWPGNLAADETTRDNLVQSTEVAGDRERVSISQRVRRTDGQLPPPLTTLEIHFPRGTQLNTEAFPRCGLAKLQAKGPSACAPGSRVGSGTAGFQVPFRFPHVFPASVRVFNGSGVARFASKHSLLLLFRPQAGPLFIAVGRWTGSQRAGRTLTVRLPTTAIPEYVPESLVRLSLDIGSRRDGARFLRAPCERTYRVTARYFDGSVVTSSDRARCT